MVEPTLCFSLKTGLKISAILDILLSIALFVASTLALVYFEKNQEDVLKIFADPPPELDQILDLRYLGEISVRIFLGLSIIYWIQKTWLGYVLYRAAVEENTNRCRVWIIYTFVLLVLSIAFFLAVICMQIVQPFGIPFYIVVFMVREYSVWILLRFKGKLDDGKSPLLVNANEFTNL